jgi:hypothetical protein
MKDGTHYLNPTDQKHPLKTDIQTDRQICRYADMQIVM